MQTKEEIEREVKRLDDEQPWWHDIELPFGVRTCSRSNGELQDNHNIVKWDKLRHVFDFAGKRVIDLGCNEGFFCAEISRAGAVQVLGIDVNELRIKKAQFVVDLLGYKNIRLFQKDVYQLKSDELGGRFDIALCLGLLHRVPDPFGVLRVIGDLADTVVFEWATLETDEPVMKFWTEGHKQYDPHNSGYWRISRQCVREMLYRVGFRTYCDIEAVHHRAIMAASKCSNLSSVDNGWDLLESTMKSIAGSNEAASKHLAVMELLKLIPLGKTFILVDKNWLSAERFPGRQPLPFLERNGQYWGLPADDATAIREFERLCQNGSSHIVFAWPTFWWFDYYTGFLRHLRSRFRCSLQNERLVVFDLQS